ncbi:hypothetical protein [Pseudomonas viridiflava]|uniref:hypothetical protein n=1 Tax=Pseudomonas viridiflava TaxID=33069 RepID=UPI000F08C3CF|nr:hypothetical protein [Pseudomonas viridiflava]
MEIKVNVPSGFKAVYEWVEGDLVISIEREVVSTAHKAKKAAKGYLYYKRGTFRTVPRLATGKIVAKRKDGFFVISVVTDKQPTISQSGTGSTGPRKPSNA